MGALLTAQKTLCFCVTSCSWQGLHVVVIMQHIIIAAAACHSMPAALDIHSAREAARVPLSESVAEWRSKQAGMC